MFCDVLYDILKSGLHRWVGGNRAATAIEYGLIAGGISLAIVAAVFLTGGSLQDVFNSLVDRMVEAQGKVE